MSHISFQEAKRRLKGGRPVYADWNDGKHGQIRARIIRIRGSGFDAGFVMDTIDGLSSERVTPDRVDFTDA